MLKPLKGQQRALGAKARNQPSLVRRVWLYGATDGGATTARVVSTPVPAGASYVDARAIGAGGGVTGGSGSGAGGGAYARGGAYVSVGSAVVSSIGCQADLATDGEPSSVSFGGVTFVRAAGGKNGTPGLGGAIADSIGSVRRAGSDGDGTYGGASGSDALDRDPLGIGGEKRRNPATDGRVNDGTAHPAPADFGSGGFSSAGFAPASSTTDSGSGSWTGDGQYGGAGIVVLEFWTRKPN